MIVNSGDFWLRANLLSYRRFDKYIAQGTNFPSTKVLHESEYRKKRHKINNWNPHKMPSMIKTTTLKIDLINVFDIFAFFHLLYYRECKYSQFQ